MSARGRGSSTRPPSDVLDAFEIDGVLHNLSGGRGNTWATKSVVVKPVDDEPEASWIASLASRVEQRGFRVARPIAARDGRWVVDMWAAWERLQGEHRNYRWAELLAAAAAFHVAVANEPKPEFIQRRVDRWRIADRVAWAELSSREFEDVPHLGRLLAARRPLSLPSQLVHGDLVGNVLFAEGLPPAIIDLSLYWRPTGYSAALVVGDALAWEDAPPSIIDLITHIPSWQQLLLRAVIFRMVVNDLARRAEPWRNDLTEHYRPLVDRVIELAST